MPSTTQALTSFVSSQGKPVFILRTGNEGVYAHFTPSHYQIRIVDQNGSECCHDVGFSGTRLLECLISSRGNALTREELTAYAWPERVVGQGSLNQQIYTLRQLLSDDKERSIIQTLPRRGYLIDSSALERIDYIDQPNHAAAPSPSIPLNLGTSDCSLTPVGSSVVNLAEWEHESPSFINHGIEQNTASQSASASKLTPPFQFKSFMAVSLILVVIAGLLWWKQADTRMKYMAETLETPLGSKVTFVTRDVARSEGLKQKVLVLIASFDAVSQIKSDYEVLLLNQYIGFSCLTPSGKSNSLIIHNSQLSHPSLFERVKHCYER